jgi:hypothetical protein
MDLEKVKEFLKPTKGKIILFILLFMFFNPWTFRPAFVDYKECLPGEECSEIPPCGTKCWAYFPFIFSDYRLTEYIYLYNPIFLISPIINYLLSCLIIFAYNKFRGRK